MVKIKAEFPCHLQFVPYEVRLVSAMDGTVLGIWPFKCIRRYKFDGNIFCIEAGRKAPTGQGLFEFISNECSEIYRVMDNIIRSKAVDPTMRRLSSEKTQKSTEKHNLVRKTQSVPPTPPKPTELHYDYAIPECNIPDSNTPPANIPSTENALEADNSYGVLYPTDLSPKDGNFESHFSNTPDTKSKLEQNNSYDTLQFNTSSVSQGNNDVQVQASGGVYDTLQFDQHDGKASHLKSGRSESYDKLQFNRSPKLINNLTSLEGGTCGDEKTNDFESHDGITSDNVYNTLSQLQISQAAGHADVNMYDSLADSTSLCQPNANTYDSLADTKTSLEIRPDHTDKRPKHPVSEKPIAPARPPPRKKLGSLQNEVPHGKKPAAPSKPVRVPKQRRASPDSNDGNAAPNTPQENLKEVMQQKLTKPDDNGGYASIDHDYASIDYSKVAKSDSEPSTDVVYSEPYDPGSKPIPSNLPKPAKLKLKAPKVMKNIFKKNQTPPKPKTPTDGDVNFARELKMKLKNQLKKSDGATTRGGPSTATAQGQNVDEGIYDEVNNGANNTYSKPFDQEMDV